LGPGRLVRALQEPSGSARGEAFSAGAKNTSSTVVGRPPLTATAGFHTVCEIWTATEWDRFKEIVRTL